MGSDDELKTGSDGELTMRTDNELPTGSDNEATLGSEDDDQAADPPQDDGKHSAAEQAEDVLARLFRSGRYNAVIAWFLVFVLVGVFFESVFDRDWLWMLFVAATGVVVLVPPIARRNWRMMLPWELLVLALLPILVRALFGGEIGTFSYYLSVAGLALIVTVELHMMTDLRVTHWFAVAFVTMATLASVAAWSIVRWTADKRFGTTFLIEPGQSLDDANAALMIEFGWVTLAGLVAGVLFDAYFRRRGVRLRRQIRRVIRG